MRYNVTVEYPRIVWTTICFFVFGHTKINDNGQTTTRSGISNTSFTIMRGGISSQQGHLKIWKWANISQTNYIIIPAPLRSMTDLKTFHYDVCQTCAFARSNSGDCTTA